MGSAKWAYQPTWVIDPVGGSDGAKGDTVSVPLKTRSEMYSRLAGTRLRVPMTCTIASSLNTGDDLQSSHRSDFVNFVSYSGTPQLLFSGTISAITNRSGSGATPTKLTLSSLSPSSWTAGNGVTSYLGKLVQWTDGSGNYVESVSCADLTGTQAWLSTPLTRTPAETTFTNGTTVSIYDYPSLGANVMFNDERADYTYLKVSNRFFCYSGLLRMVNCVGDMIQHSGSTVRFNCLSGVVNSLLVQGGNCTVSGGYERLIVAQGARVTARVTPTWKAIQVETGAYVTGISQAATDFEFCGTGALNPFFFSGISGGHIACSGYPYGTSPVSTVAQFDGRDGILSLSHVPNFGASTTISFTLAGTTGSTATLSSAALSDLYNNKAIGPAGP